MNREDLQVYVNYLGYRRPDRKFEEGIETVFDWVGARGALFRVYATDHYVQYQMKAYHIGLHKRGRVEDLDHLKGMIDLLRVDPQDRIN